MPIKVASLDNGELIEKLEDKGDEANLVLKFLGGTKKLNVSYGVSFINEEQAKKNLYRETKDKTINQLQDEARQIWNDALGKIKVVGSEDRDKTIFYTS